jgi:AraC-like DNA-binding protein
MPAIQAGDFVVLNHEVAASITPAFEHQSRESPNRNLTATNNLEDAPAPIISGGFLPGNGPSASLLAAFPPALVIQGSAGEFRPWVDQLLRLLLAETSTEHPGTGDVVNRLLGILFVKTIQHALDSSYPGSEKFLRDCRDDDVGIALCRLHERPDFPWTVASLAEEANLTRSTFAARFLLAVGKPPLQYLRDVRMHRASLLLRERRHSLKQIAAMAGYRTPSAFSAAFRRSTGRSPGEFRWSPESSSSG